MKKSRSKCFLIIYFFLYAISVPSADQEAMKGRTRRAPWPPRVTSSFENREADE